MLNNQENQKNLVKWEPCIRELIMDLKKRKRMEVYKLRLLVAYHPLYCWGLYLPNFARKNSVSDDVIYSVDTSPTISTVDIPPKLLPRKLSLLR